MVIKDSKKKVNSMKNEKKELKKKILIDYLEQNYGKYNPRDLKKKILDSGYTKKELDHAFRTLKTDNHLNREVISKNNKKNTKPGLSEIKNFSRVLSDIKKEIGTVLIGQGKIVDSLLMGILCNGHVLMEGVPGLAKTLAIKALAKVSGCESNRIQFTVDLLPTDIVGFTTYNPKKGFEIIKGPIFANFVIADEINRAPPKTQSALIEAMQEKQVTIGKTTFGLPLPFFVMATENPLETSGVYTLPEAQIDRFLFKILMKYPKIEEESLIMEKNATLKKFENFKIKAITSPSQIIKMQELTKKIYLNDKIKNYILKIVEMTRTKDFENGKYIDWGASPRATIGLFIASKARALIEGRNFVIPKDVKNCAHEILRHRIILTYRAGVEGINSDKIIDEILEKIRVP